MVSLLFAPDNFYGTPKPPAEPSALLLNVTDQLLPGARPTSEGKRKRNKSVSNMEKASIEPPEEEEEERPIVNGNGVALTPGQPQVTGTEAEVTRVGSLAATAGSEVRLRGRAHVPERIAWFKSRRPARLGVDRLCAHFLGESFSGELWRLIGYTNISVCSLMT